MGVRVGGNAAIGESSRLIWGVRFSEADGRDEVSDQVVAWTSSGKGGGALDGEERGVLAG